MASRPAQPPPEGPARDATRRTYLANERTQLAWWRTGLTAIAVALAIGRVIPEIANEGVRWPYTVVGAGYAIYGVALILYGNSRAAAVTRELRAGGFPEAPAGAISAITAAGIALAVATLVLVLL